MKQIDEINKLFNWCTFEYCIIILNVGCNMYIWFRYTFSQIIFSVTAIIHWNVLMKYFSFFLFLFNLVSFFLLTAFDINFPCFRSRFILTEHITVRNYLFLRTLHIGYFDQDVKIIRLIYMYNTLKYTAHIQITDILSHTHTCIRMHTLNIKRPKTNSSCLA